MSVRLLRTVCTGGLAALTVLTALTGVPGVTGHPARAAEPPAPGSSEPPETSEPRETPESRETPTTPPPTPPAAPETPEAAAGEPSGTPETPETPGSALAPAAGPESLGSLLARLQSLYRQTERATEAFNAGEETLKRQTADTRQVDARLAAARAELARGRDEAGRLAREQYQGRSELSPYLRLLLARDPQHALDQNHLFARAARDRAGTVARLQGAEKRAADLAAASRKALDRRRSLAARQRTHRDEVQERLREVEGLLAALSPEELARLGALERTQTAGAQAELLGSGVLDGPRSPSRAGAEALRFAVAQIGKPYEWGAEGPDTYDCSGLTQRAWASAGRELPRTSQEQWQTLPRVPLSRLRPGDLVVYFPEATHVALYLGDGLVVHAPRPGARIKVSPLAANPLLGAVRPDPDTPALTTYAPPELPAGATDGADEGYGGDGPSGGDQRSRGEGRSGGGQAPATEAR
ncbi:C40 family peptidase [Streptomyces showdoensis]|uniref:C40 family peptidase n=1 Tax=Streptomyces showdoensis TaxID=68268 RepID=UPI000F50A752|nr:C40 family peptidase [Streptomyces showdoensis]